MRRRYIQFIAAALAVIALTPAFLKGQQSPRQLFERAKIVEEANTDLTQAIRLYEQAITQSKDRALTAEALLRVGGCYEKLGSAEALKTYERITRDYGDQKKVTTDAARRLVVLGFLPNSAEPRVRTVLARNEGYSDASITLDGKLLVLRGGNGGITVRDLTTGQETLLKTRASSDDAGIAESPAISPDTRQIAFAWFTGEKQTDTVSNYQLRTISNEVGAKPKVLLNNPEFVDLWASWFPDGKSILATVQKRDRTWQLVRVSTSDGSFKVIASLDWRLAFLIRPPSVSPDGRFVAYSAIPNNPKTPLAALGTNEKHIYVLPVDGSGQGIELVNSASINEDPVWTADGRHILFSSNLSGNDLWSVAVRDGKPASSPTLVRREIGKIRPIGATRSESFYYVKENPGFEQTSIAELTPGGGSRVTESFVGLNPTWSPDGKSLAFTRHRTGNTDRYDLVVRSVATGNEKLYTHDGFRTGPPRWFHDGKGLMLPGRPSASDFFDLRSGEFRQLLEVGSFLSDMGSLSLDDQTLYTPSRDSKKAANILDRIVAIDLNSGTGRQVVTFPDTIRNGFGFAISPDGLTFAIARLTDANTREWHLAVVRVDGSDYREILVPFYGARFTALADKMAWSKDSRAIILAVPKGENPIGGWQIMRIGIDGGKPEYLGLTIEALSTFDLSPDGSRIAFSTAALGNTTSELLAIDNLPALLKDLK